jgi:hypothetical protein
MFAPLQETEEGLEETLEHLRVNLIHDGSHLRVGRDRLDAPDILEIGGKCRSFCAFLKLKQRGVLKAKHSQGTHAHVP